MFDKSEQFPEGWFYIKNHSNGYVLMVENDSQETGIPIVLSALRTKNYTSQLWRYDPEGYLVNKKSGQVMDVAKGTAKAGVDIVQQIQSTNIGKEANTFQKFGLSPYGHIYLVNKPSLVFGVKESFFSRREGLHVHLQLVDKRHLDRKEQRWDFVLPIVREAPQQPKRSASASTAKSVSSTTASFKGSVVAQIKEEDDCSIQSGSSCNIEHTNEEEPSSSFPETEFFLKSKACELFVSLEDSNSKDPGSKLSLASLRKKGYDSQLWKYDCATGCISNKLTGLMLTPEHSTLKEGADIVQSTYDGASDKAHSWSLTHDGEIALANDEEFVLGYKESWFSSSREGAHLHLQKRNKGHEYQKFTIVLPVYKKSTSIAAASKTTEAGAVQEIEEYGSFPEGFFFVKSQAHGLVLTVLETGVLAAEAVATQLDTSNYSRQLWKYNDGFLVNKSSDMVLDVRGGTLKCGASICQYTMKKHNNANQQWALTSDGVIFTRVDRNLVLSVNGNETVRSKLHLAARQSGHKEQLWSFILPVFKKKQTSISQKATVRYATYPSGWFFIRSFVSGSTSESPLVLTASNHTKCSTVVLRLLDRQNWQTQLWTYSSGKLINYATDLQIDVASATIDAQLVQNTSSNEKWRLSTDGYLFYGDVDAGLVVTAVANKDSQSYSIKLAKHSYTLDSFRWGLLTPVFRYHFGMQVLSHWSITVLKEWRKVIRTTTSKLLASHSPIAEAPQVDFYISGADGHTLVPEKMESGSILVIKKLDINSHEHCKWSFRNGYIVHCLTGLVLSVKEGLAESASLYLATQTSDSNPCQLWTLRTDGSIISQKDDKYGLTLIQVSGIWTVQLSMFAYYSWRLLYGKYEARYSKKEKRELSYLVSFQRIVLTTLTTTTTTTTTRRRYMNNERKLVTYSYGIFPKGWIFIRSKCDENLLITVSTAKKGAKLILAALDQKLFRRQLWRYREDGCLVNFDTDYVIDVAGGKLLASAHIIQWHAKFLRSSRKNQMWGLSVDGHIHPQSVSSLVLSADDGHVQAGAELKLAKRGESNPDNQQWSFAVPVFKKSIHMTDEAQQAHKESLVLEKIGSTCFIDVSTSERYEHTNKRVIIRRYGVYPEGKFFIRCVEGDKHLALTAERVEAAVGAKYEAVIRTLDFKNYKRQLWTYQGGHLVNEETGLALDAQESDEGFVESEQPRLHLRERTTSGGQYWDLGANGEIHLRSNQKLAIGVAQSSEASVEGSYIGLRSIRVVRTITGEKEYVNLKSEKWLQWYFSKPIFGKQVTTTTAVTQESSSIFEIEDQTASVKEEREETFAEEDSDEEDEFEEHTAQADNEESDIVLQTPIQTIAPAADALGAAGTIATVVDGASRIATEHTEAVASGESTTVAEESTRVSKTTTMSSKVEQAHGVATESHASPKPVESHLSDAKKQHVVRQDSFQLEENYIPIGFEKIVRYRTQHSGFPTGYFFIKSSLHGYVLDVVGEIHSESQVVLTQMKTTDFASQLWSYKNGCLYNLKGRAFVLDAAKATLVAGEKIHLSDAEGTQDQVWEHTNDGFIFLRHKRSFVLSLKETKRSDQHSHIDVFVHEAKSLNKKEARPEQHWEVLVPSLIPVQQGEASVKIVEAGKVERVTSSASAVISYKWLKETYRYMITQDNQWPDAENCFFIRFGDEDHYLCAGETAKEQITMQRITDAADHQRFLWVYVDGYLINLKYRLRLILNSSHKWLLSSAHSTLNQSFSITSTGRISIRIHRTVYYIRIVRTADTTTTYTLGATTDDTCRESYGFELHIPVVSEADRQRQLVTSLSSAVTWIRKQKSDYRLLTCSSTLKAAFPSATWFFIKADHVECRDALVLSTQEDSSHLALRKLDFRQFKSQLWTCNNGLLINYGSKFVISVKDAVSKSAQIIQMAEAGISTQKWILTAAGHIELDTYDGHTLGCKAYIHNEKLFLHVSDEDSPSLAIKWKFSTPIFGYKKQTSVSAAQTTTDLTSAIESGAVIEAAEDVSVSDSLHRLLVTRTTKHVTTIYRETHIIIRSWIITFRRQLSTCQTQKEYMTVIEKQKQLLYSCLAEQLNTSVYHLTEKGSSLVENFIEELKGSIESSVFRPCVTYLAQFTSEQNVSLENLDIAALLSTYHTELGKKVEAVTSSCDDETEQAAIEKTDVIADHYVNIISSAYSKTEYVDSVLLIVETIQTTVQSWLKLLRTQIRSECHGEIMTQEAYNMIKLSQAQFVQKLHAFHSEFYSIWSKTTHISEELQFRLQQSVITIVEDTNRIVNSAVFNSQELIGTSASNWEKRTESSICTLLTSVDNQKATIQSYHQTISSDSEEKTEVASLSTDNDHEIDCSRIEITTSLSEAKSYIQSWFNHTKEQIAWYSKSDEVDVQDLLVIVKAAKLNIVSKIDEAIASFTLQSSSLTYLTVVERRRLITYYTSIKVYILTTIETFEATASDADSKTAFELCNATFDAQLQEIISTKMDHVFELINTTENISEKIYSVIATTTQTRAAEHQIDTDETVTAGEVEKSSESSSNIHLNASITLVSQESSSTAEKTNVDSNSTTETTVSETDVKIIHQHSSSKQTTVHTTDDTPESETIDESLSSHEHQQHTEGSSDNAVIGGAAVVAGVVGAALGTIVHEASGFFDVSDMSKETVEETQSTSKAHVDKHLSAFETVADTTVVEGIKVHGKQKATSTDVLIGNENSVNRKGTETEVYTSEADTHEKIGSSVVHKVEDSHTSTSVTTTFIENTAAEQEVKTEVSEQVGTVDCEAKHTTTTESTTVKEGRKAEDKHTGSSTDIQLDSSVSGQIEYTEDVIVSQGTTIVVEQTSDKATASIFGEQQASAVLDIDASEKISSTQIVTHVTEETTVEGSNVVDTDASQLTSVSKIDVLESNTTISGTTTSAVDETITEEASSSITKQESTVALSTDTCINDESTGHQAADTVVIEATIEEHGTSGAIQTDIVNNDTFSNEHTLTAVEEANDIATAITQETAVEECHDSTTTAIENTVSNTTKDEHSSSVIESITRVTEGMVVEDSEISAEKITVGHEETSITKSTQAGESISVSIDSEQQSTVTKIATSVIETATSSAKLKQAASRAEVIEECSTVTDVVVEEDINVDNKDTTDIVVSVTNEEHTESRTEVVEELTTVTDDVTQEETSVNHKDAADTATSVTEQEQITANAGVIEESTVTDAASTHDDIGMISKNTTEITTSVVESEHATAIMEAFEESNTVTDIVTHEDVSEICEETTETATSVTQQEHTDSKAKVVEESSMVIDVVTQEDTTVIREHTSDIATSITEQERTTANEEVTEKSHEVKDIATAHEDMSIVHEDIAEEAQSNNQASTFKKETSYEYDNELLNESESTESNNHSVTVKNTTTTTVSEHSASWIDMSATAEVVVEDSVQVIDSTSSPETEKAVLGTVKKENQSSASSATVMVEERTGTHTVATSEQPDSFIVQTEIVQEEHEINAVESSAEEVSQQTNEVVVHAIEESKTAETSLESVVETEVKETSGASETIEGTHILDLSSAQVEIVASEACGSVDITASDKIAETVIKEEEQNQITELAATHVDENTETQIAKEEITSTILDSSNMVTEDITLEGKESGHIRVDKAVSGRVTHVDVVTEISEVEHNESTVDTTLITKEEQTATVVENETLAEETRSTTVFQEASSNSSGQIIEEDTVTDVVEDFVPEEIKTGNELLESNETTTVTVDIEQSTETDKTVAHIEHVVETDLTMQETTTSIVEETLIESSSSVGCATQHEAISTVVEQEVAKVEEVIGERVEVDIAVTVEHAEGTDVASHATESIKEKSDKVAVDGNINVIESTDKKGYVIAEEALTQEEEVLKVVEETKQEFKSETVTIVEDSVVADSSVKESVSQNTTVTVAVDESQNLNDVDHGTIISNEVVNSHTDTHVESTMTEEKTCASVETSMTFEGTLEQVVSEQTTVSTSNEGSSARNDSHNTSSIAFVADVQETAVAVEIVRENSSTSITGETTAAVIDDKIDSTTVVREEECITHTDHGSVAQVIQESAETTSEISHTVETVISDKDAKSTAVTTRRDSVVEEDIVIELEEDITAEQHHQSTTAENNTESIAATTVKETTETTACEESESILIEDTIEQKVKTVDDSEITAATDSSENTSTPVEIIGSDAELLSHQQHRTNEEVAEAETSHSQITSQETEVTTVTSQKNATKGEKNTTAVTHSEVGVSIVTETSEQTEVQQITETTSSKEKTSRRNSSINVVSEAITSEEITEIVSEEVSIITEEAETKQTTETTTTNTITTGRTSEPAIVTETNEVITGNSGAIVGEIFGQVQYEVVSEVVTEVVDDIEVVEDKQHELEKKKTSTESQSIVLTVEQQQTISKVITHYETVTESVCDWYVSVIEKLSLIIEVKKCHVEEIATVIEQEEAELQSIIEQCRSEMSESCKNVTLGSIAADWSAYYLGLKKIVEEHVSSLKASITKYQQQENALALSQQFDVSLLKGQFQKVVYSRLSEARVQVAETVKSQTITTEVHTDMSSQKIEMVIESGTEQQHEQIEKHDIVHESIQQAQEQIRTELSATVATVRENVIAWYYALFRRIKTVRLEVTDEVEYRKRIETIIQQALKEVSVIVSTSKSALEQQSIFTQEPSKITECIQKARKQAILSLETVQTTIQEQVVIVQELAITENTTVFEEKIHVLEEQVKRSTQAVLEYTVQTAVSVGFEGKTIEYVQTSELPESFKEVKYVAFDLMDTVLNYRATIAKAWSELLLQKKNGEAVYRALSQIDIDALVVQWYRLYLEKRLQASYSQSDLAVFVAALTSVLDAFSVPKMILTEAELHTLASLWCKLDLFEDASASIHKLKKLNNTYAISISHAFSIRSMMDLARHGCLCWQAQFTADMFAACTINNNTLPQDTLISSTAMLLGVRHARELAVVSANPAILEAAKAYGANTVYIHHHANKSSATCATDVDKKCVDVEFDGLDVFAESFETFHATKAIIAVPGKNSTASGASLPASRTWFQRVVSRVVNTAEAVGHVVIS